MKLYWKMDLWTYCFVSLSISQIFKVAGQLSCIETTPKKSGLASLDDWVGLKCA